MQAVMTLRGKFITLMVGASLLTTVGVGAVFINNMWGEADRQVENFRATLTTDVKNQLKMETQMAVSVIRKFIRNSRQGN